MRRPVASIVMINRNGAETIPRAFDSLAKAIEQVGAGSQEIEFLFVDNASTDHSVTLANERFPRLSCESYLIEESSPGVNFARRAGLSRVRGEYVIFIDSDVAFGTDWLKGYLDAFGYYQNIRVFGGRVKVGAVDGPVPSWLDLTGPYTRPSIIVQCDNGDRLLTSRLDDTRIQGPVGPNMAFRRNVFDEYGPFDIRFGLRPGSLVAGAEAEYFHRLAKTGESFCYVPDACVWHPVRRDQLTKAYFQRRLSGVGRVLARMQYLDKVQAPRILGVKRYLFRQLAVAWVNYGLSWGTQCPKRRFYKRCDVSIVWGQIQEDWHLFRKDEYYHEEASSRGGE